MSQDIVRQNRGHANGADDLWSTGAAGAPGNGLAFPTAAGGGYGGGMATLPPGGGENKPLEMVHRSLRGRYKLAILLAAVGSVVGAAAGWKLNERTYRALGLIKINPQSRYVSGAVEQQTEYSRYMTSEASSIANGQDVAERAMSKPAWTSAGGMAPSSVEARSAFLSKLRATYNPSAFDMAVTFEDRNPKLAVAGVQAVLEAYSDIRVETQKSIDNQPVDFFEKKKNAVLADITTLKQEANTIQRDALGDAEEGGTSLARQRDDFMRQLAAAQLTLNRMEAMVDVAKANPQPLNERVLAGQDPFFARMVATRDEVLLELTRLQKIQGRGSPMVIKLQSNLEALNGQIESLGRAIGKDVHGVLQPLDGAAQGGAGGIIVNDAEVARRKSDIAQLEATIKWYNEQIKLADNKRAMLAEVNNKIELKQNEIRDIDAKLALAEAKTLTLNAPFKTLLDPTPKVANDARPSMATFGFLVGAGLPFAGLVLLGLMDRKYRYSDETNSSSVTRGIPLLGILPNLPDRLSDPSQASVAAHCVHQIRTMLQLNAVRADGPTVLSVTSATSGDGKTSLSLALGLSFAASGSRTLLIDTDLIGAGLSNRLGIREPQGISEAIVARNPMEFVRDTDVADLSILPVGNGGPQNASAFSPNAVRRLLGEMRKHFDLILIDTGPVLGSIEATPVVASSDAVILTASRGQNRDLVEKAILQLRNAGARVAGFVFNRANAKDFERSISGISLRSVSRAQSASPGTPGQSVNGKYQDNRLGPLVHSVRGTTEN